MLLLLAVASAVIVVAPSLFLRQFLVSRLDDDLRSMSHFVVVAQGSNRPGGPLPQLPQPDGGHGPGPQDSLDAKIVHGSVATATVSQRYGNDTQVPTAEYADLLAVPVNGPPVSADLGVLGTYRLGAVTAPDGSVQVTGMSEERLQETVNRLVTTEVVVAALVLILGGVAGAFVVRRELRPLERVAATGGRVSRLPLDRGEVELAERVPDTDPRTEVGQVGTALNRMLDHVGWALESRQESETRLRQFLADASH